MKRFIGTTIVFGLGLVPAIAGGPPDADVPPLKVCATIPDLGLIAKEIGGAEVEVETLAKGPQDPHFLEAKPSFIKILSRAELFIQNGLELEVGWAPVLLRSARNPSIQPGQRGHLDASTAIVPLERPSGALDRSAGDVHPLGNPHFLLDPLNGLRAAEAIAAKLAELMPDGKAGFEKRLEEFRRRLAASLLGEPIAAAHPGGELTKLLELLAKGGLDPFLAYLDKTGRRAALGGWLGDLLPHRGAKLIADHNLWPYFAKRFGVEVIEFLEPKPGLSPTTKHLGEVVESVRQAKVKAILSVPYFDARHAEFVARHTGASIARMTHQAGGREGADGYLGMCDYNVRALNAALSAPPR
jgi:ABC-type Zn uptake system ZnuABC Zn-binding protein ZnuA